MREIVWREPEAAFHAVRAEPWLAWLDSGGIPDERGRFSYLCVAPFRRIEARQGRVSVDGAAVDGDPFTVLAAELTRWRQPAVAGPAPFLGGAVGFLGYELGTALEHLTTRHPAPPDVPDMAVGLYDLLLVFDRAQRRAWIVASGLPETDLPARRARAERRIAALHARLAAASPPAPVPPPAPAHADPGWRPDLARQDYEARVRRVLDYIVAGDIYQANFTMAHRAPRPPGLDAADLHLALRAESPAPFGAFLACGPDLALASVSPERFLSLDPSGRVETRPIKGTRPRAADPAADAALRAALAESRKDRAENLMIVDLLRNDISRVAEIGSVRVPALCAVESFASVHHLVSVVEGRLCPGCGPVDLLRATFPGGSVTGAPKIRAMQIIDELEAARRGPYCGSIAWIGFDGTMDSNIVIRTLVVTRDAVVAQAGGGIVADSDPAAEYEEMLVKVAPLLRALARAGGAGERP